MRRRNLIVALVLVAAVISAGLLGRKHGLNLPAGRPTVTFGARAIPPGASSGLIFTNAWTATSPGGILGVYAGRDRSHPQDGLFVIVRRVGTGRRRITRIAVHGSGAVTLLRPSPPANETTAFNETLRFVTASGATGTLNLSDDRVTTSG